MKNQTSKIMNIVAWVAVCWLMGSVILGVLKLFASQSTPENKPCDSYANSALMHVPARCLKDFQYEEEIIEVSINGEVREYQKNASQQPELLKEQ